MVRTSFPGCSLNRQSDGQRRRWESNPLDAALQAAAVPSGSSVNCSSVLARNRTWSTSFAGSCANPAHSKDMLLLEYLAEELNPVLRFRRPPCCPSHSQGIQVARPGIEPGPTASEADMLSGTPTGHIASIPTWNRTRTKTLGESCAIRYTIGTKSRRLDLHQHRPVYKTGAFLRRATSASSTSARSRTPCGSFGGCLLSREHTRVAVSTIRTLCDDF
jgi:hypothetical protein